MKQEEARPANVTDVGLWNLVQSVRARHQRDDEAGGCAFCSQTWPCEAEQRAMVADVAARMPLRPPMPRRSVEPTTGEQWGSRAPYVVASGAHAAPDPAAIADYHTLIPPQRPSLPAALTLAAQLPAGPAELPSPALEAPAAASVGFIAPAATPAAAAAAATVLLATVVPPTIGAESDDQPVQAITTLPPVPQRVHQLIADAKSQPAPVENSPLSSRSTPDAAVISPRLKPSPTTRRQARPVPAVTVPQPKAAPSKAPQSRGRTPKPSPNLVVQRRQARSMSALPPAAPNVSTAKAGTPAEQGDGAAQAVPTLRRATRSQRRAG